MRLLRCLIISLAICLLAIPALVTPVQATSEEISLSPDEGCVGDKLTVNGKGFHPNEIADVYYDDVLQDSTKIHYGDQCPHGFFDVSFTVPEGCQGYHEVYAEDTKGSSAMAHFVVEPGISLDTKSGHAGDSIEVIGGGFPCEATGINIRYYLDDDSYIDFPVSADADEDGSWEENFSVPASAKGKHTVGAYYDDDKGTLSDVREASFEVQPDITLNPDSGSADDIIAVSGTGFGSEDDIKLKYDSQEVGEYLADEYGNWGAIVFTIPDGSKGDHLIRAFHSGSIMAIASATFHLGAGIRLQPAMTPDSPGHVGQTFNVTGKSFDPSVAVSVSYQNETADVFSDAKGDLPAVTFVARGRHGEQYVNASYNGNTVRPAVFYIEGTPPDKPRLISPVDTRTGFSGSFTGRICPTFTWSNVTDPSGIASYDLDTYGGDDSLMSISVPIEDVSFQGDIVAYTLPEKYALSPGTYYWRVRAIDGAGNEGKKM